MLSERQIVVDNLERLFKFVNNNEISNSRKSQDHKFLSSKFLKSSVNKSSNLATKFDV